MNKIYRLIWSRAKEKWVVVSEKVAAKGAVPSATVGALTLAALLAAGGGAFALDPGALPGGGRITAGSGAITTSGSQMTINQSSQQLIANWDSFNIGQNAGVRFNQPNSSATALNRIQDQNPTQILGSLSANGRVFLLNPAGIVFGQGAKVDVGGLVASSLNMLDSDFLAGRYTFSNAGNAGSILNQGNISANGGIVALIAPKVANEGTITADNGSAALIAGNRVSVDFTGDGLITYTVDQGAVDALAENKGLIKADGGLVVMTAKAADALADAVVNNSGAIEARALANREGRILLLSDMQSGTTAVGGTLDASAPDGGDGGFVETSGGRVEIGAGARITTKAANGKNGTWLLDPADVTIADTTSAISCTAGVCSPGSGWWTTSIAVTTLETALASGNVEVTTTNSGIAGGAAGNITVASPITWNTNTLTLTAGNDININAVMTANDTASLDLEPGSGKVNVGFNPDGTFKGRVDFFQADGVTPRSGTGFLTINNTPYTVITDLGNEGDESTGAGTLQGMAYGGNSSGYFALGSNIDAAATSGWNYGEGFMPIGSSGYAFTGTFDGLGHTISNLTINRPSSDNQGLFGYAGGGSVLRNVGLTSVDITGSGKVGGLVGYGYGTTIVNSYVMAGSVNGGDYSTDVGGLVGYDYGGSSITNSHASVNVAAGNYSNGIGGLMGYGYGSTILDSYALGDVTGGNSVGGLVGYIKGYGTTISNSHANGQVTGNSYVGGLVGSIMGSAINIADSHATGDVWADANPNNQNIGGLVGYLYAYGGPGSGSTLNNSYATGAVHAGDYSSGVGGLVGYNYGVSVIDSHAAGIVTTAVNSDSIGGLVGNNAFGAITNSSATGNVTAGASSSNVGGLVGNNANSDISGSYASGEVAADAGTGQNVGGLVGYNNSSSIDNSYASGPVTGNSYVGGLVGYDNGIGIINSLSTGRVTGSIYAGGLVGDGSGSSVITASFWDRTVNADPVLDNGLGAGRTTTELKTLTTFTDASWDIDDAGGTFATWRIYDGNTYPLLRGFLTPLTITATPVTKTYDGTAYTGDLNATYSDPTAPVSGHLRGHTAPYASFINAGTYSPSPYSDQQGYDITVSGDSSLTITPAALTVTASDATKTYGQTPTLSAFTSSGLQNGETIGSVTLASAGTTATAGVSATPYVISASGASDGTFDANNYTITYNSGALTVTPAPLTVTAADATKSYGQAVTFTGTEFTSSGLQNGETIGSVTLDSAGAAASASAAGSPYAITASNATGGTFNADNYTITYNDGALTVSAAPAVSTVTDEPIQQPAPTPPAVAEQGAPPSVPQPPAPLIEQTNGTTPTDSDTSTGISGGVDALSVTVVSPSTSQSSGMIAVTVPDSMAQPGSAFSFQLPEQAQELAATTSAAANASLANGESLPGWLRYNPESNTFFASDVPAGSLPCTIIVTVGEQSWTVAITKQDK
ncbi:GLUG motif-containing protein [Geobacter sp.]|uniref:two-partner secretion domain-containing protein n=1 Tax=Geobacter sp. TaxID=46610 RepID=UPI0026063B4C|nr:GLUG motif-containing protein [Geobacter sp.]